MSLIENLKIKTICILHLSDPKSEVQKLYGVWKEKSLYSKKFMGTERSTFLINEKGLINKIYRR
jgi:peroxiredoxin Q/BCP